ncbi:hypothetical protein MUK70_13220 [Dyadobacter chenwenxiniae]|uniref:Uncharacterized protein n=1 Tax=Dyadobacter chenwenxiniae TaxID=2906456 RepID=A0A9X1TBT4_9BACT|nr:hypothetical protein [Dyadobacter chenwenxiniae]MCF0060206.1 hypothetical protein [Dyadobacter chenwenxiniae]UON85943.1 hypothetical protein MUK70_13220 [Dyadobacter chenwenxiniae]
MTRIQESKENIEPTFKNLKISALRQEMLNVQKDKLIAHIREFFDEGDACGPVCYLNELMKRSPDNAEGLRISSFLMRLERFDRCITVLRK